MDKPQKNQWQSIIDKISAFPFHPKKFPFFYGWMILLWGTIGVILSVPGQTVGVSVFTEPLINTFGLERLWLSFAYGLGTMGSAFLITYAGRLYDKYGARIVGSITALCFGFVLYGLGHAYEIAQYMANVSGISIQYIAYLNLTLGFFMMRFFGQGVLTMVSRNMIMKWFDRNRGFANAIHSIAVAFAFAYAPKIFDTMIESSSWNQTWISLGLFIGIIFLILIWIFFRDNPKSSGLQPDGKLIIQIGKKIKATTSEINYTLSEAKKQRVFWAYTLALTLSSLLITAITFHIESVFSQGGYSKDVAVSIFLPVAVVAVIFNFAGSWLSDYIKLSNFLFLHLFGMILSAISVILIDFNLEYGRLVMIIGNGITGGMFGTLISLTWPRFFGTKYLGEVSGYAMSWLVAGSAIGPFLFSGSMKFSGSYNIGAYICLIILVSIFILSLKIRNTNSALEESK